VIPVLVGKRFERLAPAGADLVGQLNHLVNRLLSIQAHDEVANLLRKLRVRLPRAGLLERLDHHGNHDLRPTLADQGERAVEIE